MNKNDVMYGLYHWEIVVPSVIDVLEQVVDEFSDGSCEEFDVVADLIQWPLRVLEFRRIDVSRYCDLLANKALEHVLEILDEEHSDPDGDQTKPTPKMIEAAKAFAGVVCGEYVSWACEKTGKVIDVTREMAKEMLK